MYEIKTMEQSRSKRKRKNSNKTCFVIILMKRHQMQNLLIFMNFKEIKLNFIDS